MFIEKKQRSFLKALSWRVLATLTTFIISFFITGSILFASSISVIEFFGKMLLYYIHERAWEKVAYGKVASENVIG
ncbi:MAG: Protein of unknown function rane [Gammaproteobacteria bacterium]|jgi:uncharacterized membrane protein|nr:Protein of unknown function rane [Gammaproteobacteria bacterium]MCE3238237.1 Protein of unknown function rane [Gammaproteobacteria bacterium]